MCLGRSIGGGGGVYFVVIDRVTCGRIASLLFNSDLQQLGGRMIDGNEAMGGSVGVE